MTANRERELREFDTKWVVGLGVVVAGFSLFCGDPVVGNEGNLQLSYTHDTDVDEHNFHPLVGAISGENLVVGGTVDYRIQGQESRPIDHIEDISLDSSRNFTLSQNGTDGFLLTATGIGATTLQAAVVTESGERLTDSFDFRADEARALALQHSCESNSNIHGVYLVDSDIRIGYSLLDGSENNVILAGYGYHPVEFDGDADLTLDVDSRDLLYWEINTGDIPGTARMLSTIDDTELTFEIVEAADVDDAELVNGMRFSNLEVGESTTVYPLARVGGHKLCYADIYHRADVLTSDRCEINGTSSPRAYPDTGLTLTRLAEGVCEIEISFPDGNDGQGVTRVVTL